MALNGIGYLLFSSFIPFLILFFIYGLSLAMSSGSDRALLYDNLVSEGREKDYVSILSKARAIGSISLGVSILIGGVLYDVWSWNGVYITLIIGKLIGLMFVVAIPELSVEKNKQNNRTQLQEELIQPEKNDNMRHLIVTFFKTSQGRILLCLFTSFAIFEATTVPLYICARSIL